MLRSIAALALAICSLAVSASAANTGFKPQADAFTLDCTITPAVDTGKFAPASSIIPKSNNLWRKTGEPKSAQGQMIYVFGQVLDEKCLPVENAVIELWQVDAFGIGLDQPEKMDRNFAGSGRAVSDNRGYFTFITTFPAPVGKHAPRLHYRVQHPKFQTFSSSVYFENDWRNAHDPSLDNLKQGQPKLLMARVGDYTVAGEKIGLSATFRVTLQGHTGYERF